MTSTSLVIGRPVALRPEIVVAVEMEAMAVVVRVAAVVVVEVVVVVTVVAAVAAAVVNMDREFVFTSQERDGACRQ